MKGQKTQNGDNVVEFSVYSMANATLMTTYLEREHFDLEPAYQREGNLWTREKKQLLIDSLLNGYDIPKLYVHRLPVGSKKRFAVIDGKQRLQAIWGFLDGDFPLGKDFVYLRDDGVVLAGLTYSEIAAKYPLISARLSGTSLPVMVVDTPEIDLIEDLFSRLNEAVPLNAAERRNALGGPATKAIREMVSKSPFFLKTLPFTNKRYRQFDLACKFLCLAELDRVVDTKRVRLDEFVKRLAAEEKSETVRKLQKDVMAALASMAKVFVAKEALLRNVGVVVPVFWLFFRARQNKLEEKLQRSAFQAFEKHRAENRRLAEKDLGSADYSLVRFDELGYSLNDGGSILYRYAVMAKRLLPALAKLDPAIEEALLVSG